MKLQTAQRKRAKIKMALQGPSGSGKTYSSLLIDNGLCNDWPRVAVMQDKKIFYCGQTLHNDRQKSCCQQGLCDYGGCSGN